MSLSFDNWTNVVLEGLKEHGKKLSEECVSRLASPLYIPHPILDEYLSRLNIFLDLPKPTQEEITKAGLHVIGPIVETMAEAEQLKAHAQAVRVRLSN